MTPAARAQAALDLLDLLYPASADAAGPEDSRPPPEADAALRSDAQAEAARPSAPPADRAVADYLRGRRYIGAKDRRAVTELLYGVLRAHARLGWWLARVGAAPTNRLRLIAFLLLHERLPLAQLRQLFDGARYAPAPLDAGEVAAGKRLAGAALDDPEQPLDVRCEVPAWLLPQLRAGLGADLERELAALSREAPLDLRVNSLKATRADAQAALAEEEIASAVGRFSPWALRLDGRRPIAATRAFRAGLVEVQDEGSQLIAALVGARPGERVCDLCAGAGGKTLALAAAMENRGQLVACDTLKGRLDRSAVRLKRAGAHNVTRRHLKSESDPWIKRHKSGFHRVLVDAPCSGSGAWRRNPDARWRLTPEGLEELTALQGRLLVSAARLVRPGGRLVYATCSLLPAENHAQVERFLERRKDFRLVPLAEVWAESLPGRPPSGEATLLLRPAAQGTDGFFVAVFERGAGAAAADPADGTEGESPGSETP